jgi:hypothetical protein
MASDWREDFHASTDRIVVMGAAGHSDGHAAPIGAGSRFPMISTSCATDARISEGSRRRGDQE